MDVAYYGTTISSPLVLKSLNSHATLVTNMLYILRIFVIAALPGYILAVFTIDRLGRKAIQCLSFTLMTLANQLLVNDDAVDRLRNEVEEQAIHLLSFSWTIAERDGRLLVATFSIARDLERIGDGAAGIAQNILQLPF